MLKGTIHIAGQLKASFDHNPDVQQAITALFQKPVCNRINHCTSNSPVQTYQIQRAICNILKISNVQISVGDADGAESAESNLMSKFLGDLLPYFASYDPLCSLLAIFLLFAVFWGWRTLCSRLKFPALAVFAIPPQFLAPRLPVVSITAVYGE